MLFKLFFEFTEAEYNPVKDFQSDLGFGGKAGRVKRQSPPTMNTVEILMAADLRVYEL